MSDGLFMDPFAVPEPEPERELQPERDGGDALPLGREREGAETVQAAVIPLEPERAVEAFMEYIHLWWPARLRVFGADSYLGFEDGHLVEEGSDERWHHWADVADVRPGELHLNWSGAPTGSEGGLGAVAVVGFTEATGGQTAVTAAVTGPPPSGADWTEILTGYARFTGGSLLAD